MVQLKATNQECNLEPWASFLLNLHLCLDLASINSSYFYHALMRTTEYIFFVVHVVLQKASVGWGQWPTFPNIRALAPFLHDPISSLSNRGKNMSNPIPNLNKLIEQWLILWQKHQKVSGWEDDWSDASWFLLREWYKIEISHNWRQSRSCANRHAMWDWAGGQSDGFARIKDHS